MMMTPHKRLMRGDPGSTLDNSVDLLKCDWGVHYKIFPMWTDAFEAILAGPQGEWPEGFQIFNDRMVGEGSYVYPPPFKSF